MLRYLTAGESHGKALVAIVDGLPRGLQIDVQAINEELKIRQTTYGRGGRSKLESDEIEFLSGLRGGTTTGNPLSFLIHNKDYWHSALNCTSGDANLKAAYRPRPGHADYAGAIKYGTIDARDVIERASARDTATRCAIGNICAQLLNHVGVQLYGVVLQIGDVKWDMNLDLVKQSLDNWDIYGVYDSEFANRIKLEIDSTKRQKDSVGGKIALIASGMPVGSGNFTSWDAKLDAKIASSLASLQTVKSVEFGLGTLVAGLKGSKMQDCLQYDDFGNILHTSNNAGGITGGMTNGNDILVQCSLKPIPTILKGLDTVDLKTETNELNLYERSDICHVPAAAIVAKNILAFTLAQELISQTGAVTLKQLLDRV